MSKYKSIHPYISIHPDSLNSGLLWIGYLKSFRILFFIKKFVKYNVHKPMFTNICIQLNILKNNNNTLVFKSEQSCFQWKRNCFNQFSFSKFVRKKSLGHLQKGKSFYEFIVSFLFKIFILIMHLHLNTCTLYWTNSIPGFYFMFVYVLRYS